MGRGPPSLVDSPYLVVQLECWQARTGFRKGGPSGTWCSRGPCVPCTALLLAFNLGPECQAQQAPQKSHFPHFCGGVQCRPCSLLIPVL